MKRIIYFAFLIGSIVLVSFVGGNISYLLFYFAVLLPILALTYSFYVYCRFKIGQEVSRKVVKAEEVPYRLVLANEDFMPFINISLNYFTDMVTIKDVSVNSEFSDEIISGKDNICLLSRQKIRVDTKMYCKYRGTYSVGVKSVSVTDFLGLFTIKYPLRETVRLTARPRIIPLQQLESSLKKNDPKKNIFPTSKLQELPDYELRQYHPGDPQKYIHWKNSARAGELLVRKQMPEELTETVIIIDLTPIEGNMEKRLQTEDNIIEVAISFAHDCYLKKIPVRIVYMDEKIRESHIDVNTGFNKFYDMCANLMFNSSLPLDMVWAEYTRQNHFTNAVILITSSVSNSIQLKLEENRRMGNEAVIIETGELPL